MDNIDKKAACDCENSKLTSVYKFNINNLSLEEQLRVKGYLLELIGKALQAVSDVRQYAKDLDFLNSQDYLNFEDALN